MLKPRKRITKKHLKEDKFVTYVFKFNDYFRREWKKLSYIGMGIVAVIVIIFMFINSRRKAELRASAELARAEISYLNEDYDRAIQDLARIDNIYKGTKSAGISVFYLANSYFNMGNYEKAEETYKRYLGEYDDDPMLHASSLAGIAATYEEREMYDRAVEYYKKAAADYPKLFTAAENLINAARCLKLEGKKEEAKILLDRVLEEYPESLFREKAEILLYQL